ncbi:MAG: hypothetical protein Q4F27_02435 [Desulfovibrionaceae bacterium]|nr:hypothetical protein [Desulfovibrionaceae bacterium]
MEILCISSRAALWEGLRPCMEARKYRLTVVPELEDGLRRLRNAPPALVVLDMAEAATAAIRAAVIEVLKINAMIHCTAVSGLSEKAFHDSMEGLGMPMGLPDPPGRQDVEKLMDALAALGAGKA